MIIPSRMKLVLFLSVAALGVTSPSSPQKHQLLGITLSKNTTPKQAILLKKLVPTIDEKATREMKMWGPFKLRASNTKHDSPGLRNGIKLDPASDAFSAPISPPCSNCTVLKAIANLAYKDGTQADVGNGVYTHHIIIMQTGRMQLPNPVMPPKCSTGSKGSAGLFGGLMSKSGKPAAHEHMKRQLSGLFSGRMSKAAVFIGGGGSVGSGSALAVPDRVSQVRSGAYIGATDAFQFTAEVINYFPVEKEIYLTIDFEWVPGKVAELHDVGMGAIGLDCGNFEIIPPKDRPITFNGGNWTITQDGYFVNFTPHLHDGGVNIKVLINEKQVCESRATYGTGDGATVLDGDKKWQTISGYTPCEYMIPFKKGDKVRMTSDYDLSKYRLRPDSEDHSMEKEAMALATFIWARAPPKRSST